MRHPRFWRDMNPDGMIFPQWLCWKVLCFCERQMEKCREQMDSDSLWGRP